MKTKRNKEGPTQIPPVTDVVWRDVQSDNNRWASIGDLPLGTALCFSCGFVLHEDEEKLTLCQSCSDVGNLTRNPQECEFSGTITIPKCLIVSKNEIFL